MPNTKTSCTCSAFYAKRKNSFPLTFRKTYAVVVNNRTELEFSIFCRIKARAALTRLVVIQRGIVAQRADRRQFRQSVVVAASDLTSILCYVSYRFVRWTSDLKLVKSYPAARYFVQNKHLQIKKNRVLNLCYPQYILTVVCLLWCWTFLNTWILKTYQRYHCFIQLA